MTTRLERFFLFAALLFTFGFIFWEWAWLRPGYAAVDEEYQLIYLQHWLEGHGLDWRFTAGAIHRLFYLLPALTGLPLFFMHAVIMLVLAAENRLLYLITRREFSERAACWAVLVNLLGAFFLVRGRGLLSFSTAPFFILLFIYLLPKVKTFAWATLWGLAAGLMLLDYEAWIFVLPAVLLAALWKNPFDKPVFGGTLLGSLVGVAITAWLSRHHLESWWAQRSAAVAAASAGAHALEKIYHLKSLFIGGNSLPYLGVENHPPLPLWSWSGFLVGLPAFWRKAGWWRLWVLLALTPLAFGGSTVEANRLIYAWPAWCMTAGAGFALILHRLPVRFHATSLALILATAGALLEAGAFDRSMAGSYARFYGESHNLLNAAAWLKKNQPDARLLNHFESRDSSPFQFLCGPQNQDGPTVVRIPWPYIRTPDPAWGHWMEFRAFPDQAPVYLLLPFEKQAARLENIDRVLHRFWGLRFNADPIATARIAGGLLEDKNIQDPWLVTVFHEIEVNFGRRIRTLTPEQLDRALAAPLLSEDLRLNQAYYLQAWNPQAALEMVSQSLAADPRRRLAWRMKLQLLTRLNRKDQLQAHMAAIETLTPGSTWEPRWLWF